MNDRQEITELVARYADGVNRKDMDAWAAVWSEDSLYSLSGGLNKKGRDAIVALFEKVLSNVDFMLQLVHNGTIDIDTENDSGSATGRWYVSEQQRLGGDNNFLVLGVYQDRYVRKADGWKFAERHLDVLYREKRDAEMSVEAFPFPEAKI